MKTSSTKDVRLRAGVTLVEMIVSSIVVAATGGLVISAVGQSNMQELAIEHRMAATSEVQNIMQRIVELPVVTPDDANRIVEDAIKSEVLTSLSETSLDVNVTDTADSTTVRIAISLTWNDSNGQQVRPVRLVAFQRKSETQP